MSPLRRQEDSQCWVVVLLAMAQVVLADEWVAPALVVGVGMAWGKQQDVTRSPLAMARDSEAETAGTGSDEGSLGEAVA